MKNDLLQLAIDSSKKIDILEGVIEMLNKLKFRIEERSWNGNKRKNKKKCEAIMELIETDIEEIEDLKSVYEIKFLKKYLK